MPRLWAIVLSALIVMFLGTAQAPCAPLSGEYGAVGVVRAAAPAPGCLCVAMGLPMGSCGRCDKAPPASVTSEATKHPRLARLFEAPCPLPLAPGLLASYERSARLYEIALPPPERPPQHTTV
ncbi:MAG TPA: hypothetical protein V6D47_15250 [Oscillatoriaceae cyanobacterium]